MSDPRDIRHTPLYREVEEFYRALHAPGDNRMTDAADLSTTRDGRLAAFTGTVFLDLEHPPVTRIGVFSLGSAELSMRYGSPRRDASDRLPRFSPDGRMIAFLSDRVHRGDFQLYLADAQGADVQSAQPVEGVIESLSWSPDGSQVLVGVAGFGADIAGAQGGSKTLGKQDALPAWAPSIDKGDAENLWRAAYVFNIAARTVKRVRAEGLNVWECEWLTEKSILSIASNSHSEGSWYQSRLLAIDFDGTTRDLYQSTDQLGLPVASPSSRHVAVIEAVCSDRLIVSGNVRLLDLQTGAVQLLDISGVDATHIKWRDETTLAFIGHRGLHTVLGNINIADASVTEHWTSLERT